MAKEKKRKFQYKRRTAEQFNATASAKGGRWASIFKSEFPTITSLKEGKYRVRLLPPTWEDPTGFGYVIFKHTNVGPDNEGFLCLKRMKGEDDPVEEAILEAKRAGRKKEIKSLEVKERRGVWMIIRGGRNGDGEDELVLWDMPQNFEAAIAEACKDEETGEYMHIDDPYEGHDLIVKCVQKKTESGTFPNYSVVKVSNKKTPLSRSEKQTEEWLEYIEKHPVPECLNFYSYDHIKGVLEGGSSKSDDDEDDDEDMPKTRKAAKSRKSTDDDEDDDDEMPKTRKGKKADPEDDDDDEEEEPKPKRGKASKKSEPEDDDDDEDEGEDPLGEDDSDDDDDEEDEPEPPKKGKSKAKAKPKSEEDDDEDEPAPKSSKKKGKKKPPPKQEKVQDDSDDEDDDDEPPPPKKKGKEKPKKAKKPADDDDDDIDF